MNKNMSKEKPVKKEKLDNLKKASKLPFFKRMVYYFDFFKIPLICLIALTILSVFIIKEIILAKDTALTVTIINKDADAVIDETFIEPFVAFADIDTSKELLQFNYDFYANENEADTLMKLVSYVSARECDIIICNRDTFDILSQMRLLTDLSEYDFSGVTNKDSFLPVSHDHTKNDTSEDDDLGIVQYGIDISGCAALNSCKLFGNEEIILCIGNGSQRNERICRFITWLYT